ncbi:hypothetical protein D3C72_2197190 [compost metagenome]
MNRSRINRANALPISTSSGASGGRSAAVSGNSGEVVIIKSWNQYSRRPDYSSLLDAICIASFAIEGSIRSVSGLGYRPRARVPTANTPSTSHSRPLMSFSSATWALATSPKNTRLYSHSV